MKLIITFLTLTALSTSFAQGPSQPEIVYFKKDWCPTFNQLKKIQELTSDYAGYQGESCCLDSAVMKPGVQVDSLKSLFQDGVADSLQPGKCLVRRMTKKQEDEINSGKKTFKDVAAPALPQPKTAEELQAEIEKLEAESIATAPKRIREAGRLELCELYGAAVLGREAPSYIHVQNFKEIVLNEAKRRKFKIGRVGEFSVGDNECRVYAALGWPDKTNTSVGSYGKHEQLIYRNGRSSTTYIYLQNGRVSGFQY